MQNQDGTPELYNLSDDISEIYNLANQYPEIVSRLKEDLTDWESNVNGKDGQKKHK
jgi:hypothetical protein